MRNLWHPGKTGTFTNINIMKYRIDAYKNGAVRQSTKLLSDIDEAIKLAYAVANHYKCYTRIARV